MGLFDKFKKNKVDPNVIYSPIKGKIIPIESLKDETFSKKVMGDGIAIIPTDGNLYAPVNGKISAILDTKHAYGISSDAGYELLIHIGQDTVNLNGEGFTCNVKQDQRIKKGDLLGSFDINYINKHGYSIATPVVLMVGDFIIKEKTNLKEVEPGDILLVLNK